MAINIESAIRNFKQRKDMMPGINQRDEYIETIIRAAIEELADMGIHLVDRSADLLFLVNYAVWKYNNRDENEKMKPWLKQAITDRWVGDQMINRNYKAMLEEVDGYDP